jgi:hypothetical protein
VRGVRHPTISSGSFLMATFFGFDNRIPLPPFFPVQRNEDGIFGLMLQQCWPDRRIGLLPHVLLHAPAARSYSPIDWNDAVRVRLDEVVIDCLLSRGTAPLVECGAHLRELGSLDLDEFEGYVRIVQQQRLIATVTLLQNGLQTFRGAPDYWSADVRGLIEALIASQTRPDFVVPRELPPETARSTSQTLVERFGELLEAWPEMIAASRRLRDAGVRLSEPLTDP